MLPLEINRCLINQFFIAALSVFLVLAPQFCRSAELSPSEIPNLMKEIGALVGQGRYGEAEPLVRRVVSFSEKTFGPEN